MRRSGPGEVMMLLLSALLLVVGVRGGVAPAVAVEIVNRIVATIDGEPITLIELQGFEERFRNNPGNAAAKDMDERAILDELITEKILKKQVDAQGLTATQDQVDEYLRSIESRNSLSEEQLRQALETRGVTWESYQDQVRADIERANLINKEIRAKVNVSPEEVQRYYEAHLGDYGRPERIHARLISLLVPAGATAAERAAVRAQAEDVQRQAAGGANFAKLAQQYSQGPAAADGGDLGEIARGQMQAAFDDAAFSLAAGHVSDVIETDTGYHVLKVEERLGESHTPLDEVSADIREQLYRQAIEDRYDRWFKKDLRERHHVEILL
jgi:peptidyl-prolyl cis-trans isomerase SurA